MDSLSDTIWDAVICGTGLQQSLLALALSRSGKNILHIDPNEYYGGPEAAFSLQEAESWVASLSDPNSQNNASNGGVFRAASITKPEATSSALKFSRSYSLALSPQLIHSRSELLAQLVSSRAHRQIDFLAVGAFFIIKAPEDPDHKAVLTRIPSTREDVFLSKAIPVKAKRGLMKFLKFVVDYDSEPQTEAWQPHADAPLTEFLRKEFKMEAELQTYIVTLTLSLDGRISTRDGLAIIHRHLSSMGVFGPGFAAIYPKWGGISEIAQVACRACAVGGAVYMLGTGIKSMQTGYSAEMELELTNGVTVKTRRLVQTDESASKKVVVSRLVSIIDSPLNSLFAAVVEGAQKPAVAVIAFPSGSLKTSTGKTWEFPVYVFAHSSDTGECPVGQSILYLTTPSITDSKEVLEQAVQSFLGAVNREQVPHSVYQLYYEHLGGSAGSRTEGQVFNFPTASPSLSFNDSTLKVVREAWREVLGEAATGADYMVFQDREGAVDDEEMYD
ncbi:GDP dissociation inhibitor [Lasiosphaeria ovina]|uniref:Rab proteins geranylgeranyltransferase n=1 Tax=Lasiosphaeria ovina TaxID=92902 RepID=A0AAE0K020_9PEZI|nr:GDP dissociation inhibitor [Lasiosphaeria ovina]